MADLTEAELAEIKARDARFAAIDLSLQLRNELMKGQAASILLGSCEADARAAMEEFSEISPYDIEKVSKIQVRVRTYIFIQRTFSEILLKGQVAEMDVIRQDYEESEG